jgi:hypothetical protein
MDENFLDILEMMIDGRNDFFIRTMQLTPHQQRPSVLSRYMLNEICYLELLNRIYQNSVRQANSTVLTVSIPANFEDSVPVLPTQAQINSSLEDIESTTSNCAICQDSISSGACRIRQCGHVYHRSCLLSWFGMSVRCPVCRHDIREEAPATATDQQDQTPSDEE